jgi:hypothetical protein
LRSTLHGEFMAADGEARFNREGLDLIDAMAKAGHANADVGELVTQRADLGHHGIDFLMDRETGWVWIAEQPVVGCSYLGWWDPMTGAQSEGSAHRDMHAAGILREAYVDADGKQHDTQVVAVLHAPEGARWDNDIAAERFSLLLRHYGDCMAIVEMNNAGMECIGYLQQHGRQLWRREKRDHKNPGKKISTVGYQTTGASKALWVGALGRALREQTLVCTYALAASQFGTFILNEDGKGEAQAGCYDDFCTGIGLGLLVINGSATRLAPPPGVEAWGGALGVKGPWT